MGYKGGGGGANFLTYDGLQFFLVHCTMKWCSHLPNIKVPAMLSFLSTGLPYNNKCTKEERLEKRVWPG